MPKALYSIKFRERGSKDYLSAIIMADDEQQAAKIFDENIVNSKNWNGYDVDKRTISWAGGSLPLAFDTECLVLAVNLDTIT